MRLFPPAALLFLALPGCSGAQTAETNAPMALERTIVLPGTRGRIDHLAIDLEGQRLFVAEVAQGTVDEVDLRAGKVAARIAGLNRPQGVAWLPAQRELVVASDDGSVRFYSADLTPVARLDLGDDADDVRIDPRNGDVVVGFGKGGLAIIDPVSHKLIGRVALPGHPEGFQISGPKAYVNVPADGSIVAADIDRQQVLARWPTGWHRLNFPMAIAVDGRSITVAYRLLSALAQVDTATGRTMQVRAICGDADDVFLRGREAITICGAGRVDIAEPGKPEASVITRKGARTGLYVPEIDQLFVAAPAGQGPAAILEFAFRWDIAR